MASDPTDRARVGRLDETPRPHLPTTQPMHRIAMAASWIREAARVMRALGQTDRADRLEREADGAEAEAPPT